MAKRVIWSTEARADIRAIDRDTALRLLKALGRFLKTDAGNVKQLEGFNPPLFRLRMGDWRLITVGRAMTRSKSCGSRTDSRGHFSLRLLDGHGRYLYLRPVASGSGMIFNG